MIRRRLQSVFFATHRILFRVQSSAVGLRTVAFLQVLSYPQGEDRS